MPRTERSSKVYSAIVVVIALVTVASAALIGGVVPPGAGQTSVDNTPADQSSAVQTNGTLAGEINLSDAATTVLGGEGDRAGYAVAGNADVNGDGASDLLVTAPSNDSTGANSGAVYLFYGPVDAGSVNVSEANATFYGAAGDYAGVAVTAGDFDGDGYDDVAIGAPRNDSNQTDTGAVYVVRGGAELAGETILPGNASATLTGAGERDLAGISLASVSNASDEGDSDSRSDALLVGAPYNDTAETGAGAGVAYLLHSPLGDDANTTNSLTTAATATYVGAGVGDLAGWAVGDAGDVDGDGVSEIVVGAPRNDSAESGTDAGAAYIHQTNVSGRILLTDGTVISGVSKGDRAGHSVAGVSDVNGDGDDDVAIGAPFNDSAGSNAGVAYLVYGPASADRSLADANVTLTGAGAGDRAGFAVSAAGSGDVSCDDVPDVLVGAPYNNTVGNDSGAAYLVYGGGEDGTRNLSASGATFRGVGEGDRAGFAVAEANDSTGDGLEDVFIGAPNNDDGGDEAGAAYLLAGDCPVKTEKSPTSTETATPSETESPTHTKTQAETPSPTPTETPTKTPKETPTLTETPTDTPTETPTVTPTETPTATPPKEDVVEFLSCTRVRIHGNWDNVEIDVHGYPGGHIDTVILSPEPLNGTTVVDLATTPHSGVNADEYVIDAVSLGRDSDDQFFSVYREHPNKEACDEQIAPDTETPTPTETPTETPTDTPTETPAETPTATPTATPPKEEVIEFLSCTRVRIRGDWELVEIYVHGYPGGRVDTEILSPEPLSGPTVIDLENASEGVNAEEYVIDAVNLGRSSSDGFVLYREHPNKEACDEQIAPDTETPTPTETPTVTATETPKETQTETEMPKETPTRTETPAKDDRAAISFVLLCTNDDGAPTVGGAGSDECPDGEPFVRWEWTGDSFEAEGDPAGTTMTATEFKEGDQSEPVEATWTSTTYDVTGAVVGAGGETCTFNYDNESEGTVESCEGSAGNGGGNEQAAVGVPDSTSGFVSLVPMIGLLVGGTLVLRRRD